MLKVGDLVQYVEHPETLGVVKKIQYEDTHIFYKVTWLKGDGIPLTHEIWPHLGNDDVYFRDELVKIKANEKKV